MGIGSGADIIMVIKSTRLGWTGYVARMGEGRNTFKILEGLAIDERTILELI